jgi:hypothetical protein
MILLFKRLLKYFYFNIKRLIFSLLDIDRPYILISIDSANEMNIIRNENLLLENLDKTNYPVSYIGNAIFNEHLLKKKYRYESFVFQIIFKSDAIIESRHGLFVISKYILPEPYWHNIFVESRYNKFSNKNSLRIYDLDFLIFPFTPKKLTLERAYIISTSAANKNYSHFLIDLVPKLLYLKQSLEDSFLAIDKIIVNGPVSNFVYDIFNLLGLESHLIIMSNQYSYLVKEAVLIGPLSERGNPTNYAIDLLTNSLLPLRSTNTKNHHYVYVSRRLAKARKMVNESKLESELIGLGFKVVLLEQLTIAEQISIFYNAKVIVAGHGAGLTNLVFSKKETLIYELFTSNHFEPSMFNIAAYRGLLYQYIIYDSINLNNDYYCDVETIIEKIKIDLLNI